jgi:predicted nucleic acid-binding protein
VIVVDTSAWVEYLRSTDSSVDRRLDRAIAGREDIAVTEVVVGELLAGARSEAELASLGSLLYGFPMLRLGGLADYERAAALVRRCRQAGHTLRRGLLDCLVAVMAIEAGASILHKDRDFDVLARHTPLQVVPLDE